MKAICNKKIIFISLSIIAFNASCSSFDSIGGLAFDVVLSGKNYLFPGKPTMSSTPEGPWGAAARYMEHSMKENSQKASIPSTTAPETLISKPSVSENTKLPTPKQSITPPVLLTAPHITDESSNVAQSIVNIAASIATSIQKLLIPKQSTTPPVLLTAPHITDEGSNVAQSIANIATSIATSIKEFASPTEKTPTSDRADAKSSSTHLPFSPEQIANAATKAMKLLKQPAQLTHEPANQNQQTPGRKISINPVQLTSEQIAAAAADAMKSSKQTPAKTNIPKPSNWLNSLADKALNQPFANWDNGGLWARNLIKAPFNLINEYPTAAGTLGITALIASLYYYHTYKVQQAIKKANQANPVNPANGPANLVQGTGSKNITNTFNGNIGHVIFNQ